MCDKFNVKVNSTEFQHYFATIFSFALATQHKFKRKICQKERITTMVDNKNSNKFSQPKIVYVPNHHKSKQCSLLYSNIIQICLNITKENQIRRLPEMRFNFVRQIFSMSVSPFIDIVWGNIFCEFEN